MWHAFYRRISSGQSATAFIALSLLILGCGKGNQDQKGVPNGRISNAVCQSSAIIQPDGLIFIALAHCEIDKKPSQGPMLIFRAADNQKPSLGNDGKSWFVKTNKGSEQLPSGCVAYYEIKSGQLDILSNQWDERCWDDNERCQEFVKDLLLKKGK